MNSKIKIAAQRIETVLTRAARSRPVPDYFSFQEFMTQRLRTEQEQQLGAIHASPGPYSLAALMLLRRYHSRVTKAAPSPMSLRRYKLLLSLYADNGRGQQVAQSVLDDAQPSDLILDLDDASPADLRKQLLTAIQSGAYEDANFVAGMLDEADHDVGERAYLQALLSFESGKLERTVKLVGKVPANAIDRPRAAWLAAKASALLGDPSTLEAILAEIADRLTPCAWLHLIELLDPSQDEQRLVFIKRRLPAQLVIRSSDPAYDEWATLHVTMMGRVIARGLEIHDALAASGETPSEETIGADPVFKRFAAAFLVEHRLGGTGKPREVVRRLDPLIAKGNLQAFRAALELLFIAGEYRAVIAQAHRFHSAANLPWKNDLDIVSVLHSAAVIEGDRLARRLQRLLSANRLEPAEGAARRITIARRLTDMGRISFLASAAELDRVREKGDIWRDCGLISLGLFRALEVEFNARLVRPLTARLVIPSLQSQLPASAGALRALLKKLAGVLGGDSLMLGDIRSLMTSIKPVEENNIEAASVRDQLGAEFRALLSPAAPQGEALDLLIAMIDSTVTGQFRNPPAHGRFLRMENATAALQHVERALDNLSMWLPATG